MSCTRIGAAVCLHPLRRANHGGSPGTRRRASGAVIPGAVIGVRDDSTGFAVSVRTDLEGRYHVAAIPAGTYTVTAEASGFRTRGHRGAERRRRPHAGAQFPPGRRRPKRDGRRPRGSPAGRSRDGHGGPCRHARRPCSRFRSTAVISPISGCSCRGRSRRRRPGSPPGRFAASARSPSTPPAIARRRSRFWSTASRTNNLTFGSLIFEPPLASIQEFKVDNSAFGAEHGHVSGAIVNIVTRSGTDEFHGELFEFFRNDALDARNFFEFTSPRPAPLPAQPVRRIAGRPDQARDGRSSSPPTKACGSGRAST